MRDEVRAFAVAEIAPHAGRWDREEAIPAELIAKLRERGWLGSLITPEWGGRGQEMISYGLMTEEIGRGCSSVRSLLTVHDMVAHATQRFGTREAKERFLPAMARGEILGALALSEPDAGSDIAGVETRPGATATAAILTGRKKWTTFGQIAGLYLVFAKVDGKATAFLLERDTPGAHRHSAPRHHSAPAPRMLAELAIDGVAACRRATSVGRSASASPCRQLHPGPGALQCRLGRGRHAAGLSGRLPATTPPPACSIGKPLSDHQLIQAHAHRDGRQRARGAAAVPAGPAGCRDPATRRRSAETMVAKYFASAAASQAATDAVQIHGANGCSRGLPRRPLSPRRQGHGDHRGQHPDPADHHPAFADVSRSAVRDMGKPRVGSSAWSGTWTTRSGTASCWKTPRSRSARVVEHLRPSTRAASCIRSPAATTTTPRWRSSRSSASTSTSSIRRSTGTPKSDSVGQIAQALNIGLDTFAFVDDQPFERDEVAFTHDKVLCIDAAELDDLLDRPEFNPRFITEESRLRRHMYMADIRRNREEAEFVGPTEEFLATLNMIFTIAAARGEDLKRGRGADRPHPSAQHDRLHLLLRRAGRLPHSPDHLLLISSLEDRHGTYGKIGLTLVEKGADAWTVKLLLMSCRVMSKGVGMIMIHHILRMAKEAGVKLRAEFLSTDRNRQMLITYRFAGFKEVGRTGDVALMENDYSAIQPPPPYVDLRVEM